MIATKENLWYSKSSEISHFHSKVSRIPVEVSIVMTHIIDNIVDLPVPAKFSINYKIYAMLIRDDAMKKNQ